MCFQKETPGSFFKLIKISVVLFSNSKEDLQTYRLWRAECKAFYHSDTDLSYKVTFLLISSPIQECH